MSLCHTYISALNRPTYGLGRIIGAGGWRMAYCQWQNALSVCTNELLPFMALLFADAVDRNWRLWLLFRRRRDCRWHSEHCLLLLALLSLLSVPVASSSSSLHASTWHARSLFSPARCCSCYWAGGTGKKKIRRRSCPRNWKRRSGDEQRELLGVEDRR